MIVNQPLEIIQSTVDNYDIKATVKGGGLSGQSRGFKTWYKQSFNFFMISD